MPSAAPAAGEFNAIKTMYRNAVDYQVRRNHRPVMPGFSAAGLVWIDGSANILSPEFTDGGFKAMEANSSIDLAQLNHYAIKSAEAFLIKQDRGDVAGVDRLDVERKYWETYNKPGDAEPRFATPRPGSRRLAGPVQVRPAACRTA